jgi:hypothetical protein
MLGNLINKCNMEMQDHRRATFLGGVYFPFEMWGFNNSPIHRGVMFKPKCVRFQLLGLNSWMEF